MAAWSKQIAAMTLQVRDLRRSQEFYRQAFGLEPQQLEEDTALVRFADMYVFLHVDPAYQGPTGQVTDQAQGGAGQLAIIVGDVDAVGAELGEHGVTLISGPEDRDWGMRTITFSDPDGHIWEIAQELPAPA